MTRAVLILTLAVFALGTQSSEPKPYPDGQFCSPKGDIVRGTVTGNHPCKCERHDEPDPDDPDAKKMCKAGEATNPTHDYKCLQWCSEKNCACPIACEVGGKSRNRTGDR